MGNVASNFRDGTPERQRQGSTAHRNTVARTIHEDHRSEFLFSFPGLPANRGVERMEKNRHEGWVDGKIYRAHREGSEVRDTDV